MDHSHAANKSIKHYADAKRVPTRKVAHQCCCLALPICLFHHFSLSSREEASDRGGDGIKT